MRTYIAGLAALTLLACSDSSEQGGGTGAASSSGGTTGTGATSGSGGAIAGAGGTPTGGTGATSTGGSSGGPSDPNECASPGADWIFCSDFEEGNKDAWDDYDGNPDSSNLLMSDPGAFGLNNNNVMRLRVEPGRGGADLVKVLPSQHDKLYARWYVAFENGFDFSAPNHGGGLHAGSRDLLGRSDFRPKGDDWFTAWLDYRTDSPTIFNIYSYYRGMYQDCADPNGQCWGDNFPCTADEGSNYCEKPQHRETTLPKNLTPGVWSCVELMVDGGTATSSESGANGSLDYWVDGKQIGPWSDLWLRTDPKLKLNILWLSLFHHGDHSVEGMLLDNVVVSKSRIGCL